MRVVVWPGTVVQLTQLVRTILVWKIYLVYAGCSEGCIGTAHATPALGGLDDDVMLVGGPDRVRRFANKPRNSLPTLGDTYTRDRPQYVSKRSS